MADSTGQALQPALPVVGLSRDYTTSISDGSMLVGDFGELLIGMRINISFENLPSGTRGSVNAMMA